jgi:hypothetical protein
MIGWKFNGIPLDRFAGLIDEVQIYSAALSPAEVQQLFAAQNAALPGPVQ